ncbi:DUF962 domain-containing protein [Frankia sp. AgPm24]|uniref:DUF962 domain-containing protein n=1 Tax=Frankia sp. AgPm24 TaxID=631128 RepID=UPI00200BB851|nr:DUF962 domain-containing protein [Frankia sp. AgPm24]
MRPWCRPAGADHTDLHRERTAGHVLFEHNRPALTRGPITYQLCGLAHWCEEIGDLLAGPARTSDVRAASPEADAGVSGG